MAKVTLPLIAQKLDDMNATLQQHVNEDREQFKRAWSMLQGEDDKPGLKGRVAALEQSERSRTKHIWAIWGTGLAAFGAWVAAKLL